MWALKQDYKTPAHYTQVEWENAIQSQSFVIELPAPIGDDFPTPVLRLLFKGPDDYFTASSMKIVSQRFRSEIEKFQQTEIDYIDIKLLNPDGRPYLGQQFYFAHLLTVIDCFDYESSDYDLADDGYIEVIRKLRLREEAVAGKHIFWVANTSALPFWIVSDEFASHIESTDLTGMLFLEFDELKLV